MDYTPPPSPSQKYPTNQTNPQNQEQPGTKDQSNAEHVIVYMKAL